MKDTRGRLLRQCQKFRHIDIDVDVGGIAISLRLRCIVGDKLQVDRVDVKAVIFRLNETAPGILADDLSLVIRRVLLYLIIHCLLPFA